jgi:drug/metabolite transporter (DMT)-like permease
LSTPTHTEKPPYPPVAEIAVISLVLVIIGGVIMAAYVPRRPPLALPTGVLVASAAVMAWNIIVLARLRDFAWDTFWLVARYALIAYVIAAGMIEWAFVKDHTRGGPLVVVTLMLVIFATDVPLIIGFTVARYATNRGAAAEPARAS